MPFFIVDTTREHIAVKEAQKLKIPIFAMVDTNSDPRDVEYVIPSNDDASKSIDKILDLVTGAVAEGLQERKNEKEGTADDDASKMETAAKEDEKVTAEETPKEKTEKEAPAPVEAAAPEQKEEEATNSRRHKRKRRITN